MRKFWTLALALTICVPAFPKDATKKIPPQSKVYLAPMGGWESDLKTALQSKKVPVEVVTERDKADYEIAKGETPSATYPPLAPGFMRPLTDP